MDNIGRIIKKRRKELKLSQREVAQKCDLTYQTILNVEKGHRVTLNSLSKICDVLDLSIELINN